MIRYVNSIFDHQHNIRKRQGKITGKDYDETLTNSKEDKLWDWMEF